MGEASKKLSISKAGNVHHPGSADNSSVVRFGKTKWFRNNDFFELNTSFSRLMALPKRGSG